MTSVVVGLPSSLVISLSWSVSTIILCRSGSLGFGYTARGARIELCFAIRRKAKDLVTEVIDAAFGTLPNTVNKRYVGFDVKVASSRARS
ncbi:hypothetical protein BGX38DRAFT_1264853 [Terfezia claveryi]|nr:hypothetical protein BGX38DRAFT_1264853 [Terfezia claveryi]